jgi:hypothetical protein
VQYARAQYQTGFPQSATSGAFGPELLGHRSATTSQRNDERQSSVTLEDASPESARPVVSRAFGASEAVAVHVAVDVNGLRPEA